MGGCEYYRIKKMWDVVSRLIRVDMVDVGLMFKLRVNGGIALKSNKKWGDRGVD